ncbi:MAG: glycine oxidase ThiO [Candidatus Poribacteria bacterium]|nr:glycine oxidase ThiO [Candidatus Poribacteria bacterium]
MGDNKADVIIIGGGVIGCAIAYNLVRAQVKPLVIDKADGVGREASWAGAGILASHASTREPYAELCRASLMLYPALAEALKAETHIDIEFIQSGSIALCLNEEEKRGLTGLAERRRDRGFSTEVLTPEQVWELEPAISSAIVGGIRFPYDAQVRNPKLVKALANGAALLGAEFLFGNSVTGFLREGDRVIGVEANGKAYCGDTFVIAAGCWSGKVAAMLNYSLPIEPARGQMVLAETMPPILRHVVDGLGVYLVPRSDGKILIGATVEFVGYDKRTTLEGTRQIIEAGVALLPELADKTFVQVWAGLRPYTKGTPYLGRLPGIDNVIVASGHFKNGILLAPITGKLISELITTGNPSMSLEPFRLERNG